MNSRRGGAQDGAAKTALGGKFAVLKARNSGGAWVDGSVGKCFGYGAQRGRFERRGRVPASRSGAWPRRARPARPLREGRKVNLRPPSSDEDLAALRDRVGSYATLLHESGRTETAAWTRALLDDPTTHFRVVRPGADIVDQTISTE